MRLEANGTKGLHQLTRSTACNGYIMFSPCTSIPLFVPLSVPCKHGLACRVSPVHRCCCGRSLAPLFSLCVCNDASTVAGIASRLEGFIAIQTCSRDLLNGANVVYYLLWRQVAFSQVKWRHTCMCIRHTHVQLWTMRLQQLQSSSSIAQGSTASRCDIDKIAQKTLSNWTLTYKYQNNEKP